MGGPPANLVRVGGKNPTDFAGSAAGMKGDRVPRRRLSFLKSDLRGRGVSGGSPTGFPSALRSPPWRGEVKHLGIFVRAKGIAGVVSSRFKPAVLTKEESNFT